MRLLRSSHPEAVFAVTLLSGVLALAVGRGAGTAWVVAAVLAGQLFVGWSNDYLDRQRDLRAERKDKPIAAGELPASTVATASLVALIACVPLSLASGLTAGLTHLAAVAAAAFYNLGLKVTPFSVVPYAVAFAALPAFVVLGLPEHRLPPAWLAGAGGLIGAGAHFTQVLPDIEDDRRQGLLGLPQRLGPRRATIAAGLLLAAAAVVIWLGAGQGRPVAAIGLLLSLLLVSAVIVAAVAERRRLAFRLTMITAAAIVLSFVLSGRAL